MNAFSASQIIDLWERAGGMHPLDRGLALLSVARPDLEWERLARLSLGERDAALMELRRRTFGDGLEGQSACPECGADVEFAFSLGDLLENASDGESGRDRRVELPDGRSLEFRLPNSFDLAAVIDIGDDAALRRTLAERCIAPIGPDHDSFRDVVANEANGRGTAASAVEADVAAPDALVVDEEILRILSDAMEEADPLADVGFDLGCPDCGHRWSVGFDILAYFWDEIEIEAQRLLGEVHLLASAYGWSEKVILSLSPRRRRTYLEMVT